MSMRMTHMLVHYEDGEGFWLMNYDDHMHRDSDYDEFVDHFSVCEKCNPGGEMGPADMPIGRLDLLVPIDHTEKEIMEGIGRAIDQERKLNRALKLIITMLLR
jgi:hypothetical protein